VLRVDGIEGLEIQTLVGDHQQARSDEKRNDVIHFDCFVQLGLFAKVDITDGKGNDRE
jgi:hypothetical protein